MSTVLAIADAFREVLRPFIVGSALAMAVLLAALCVQRAIRNALDSRQARLATRYQPDIDAVIVNNDAGARTRLIKAPRRDRRLIGRLLLRSAAVLSGPGTTVARDFCRAIGLVPSWQRDLDDRRWWRRADAARALGIVHVIEARHALVARLDDQHEEVRAAAIDALGRIGDPDVLPELLRRFNTPSLHQRVRIVDALCSIPDVGGAQLLAFVREHPESLQELSEVIPLTGGANAVSELVAMIGSEAPSIRAAAIKTLGTIGIDDRSFYHLLKALTDIDPDVRAMAARALGRSGRQDAARYLAPCLDDEWDVAANAAQALGRLAAAGHAELTRIAAGTGQSADLARQMLWSRSTA